MAQQQRIRLVSMRMQVRFLAPLSGLRIWRRGELQCRLQMRQLEIRHGCGRGVGQQLQLRFNPEPGNVHIL